MRRGREDARDGKYEARDYVLGEGVRGEKMRDEVMGGERR